MCLSQPVLIHNTSISLLINAQYDTPRKLIYYVVMPWIREIRTHEQYSGTEIINYALYYKRMISPNIWRQQLIMHAELQVFDVVLTHRCIWKLIREYLSQTFSMTTVTRNSVLYVCVKISLNYSAFYKLLNTKLLKCTDSNVHHVPAAF